MYTIAFLANLHDGWYSHASRQVLSFFLGPDRTVFNEQIRKVLKQLKEGLVAKEEALHAIYDGMFERDARNGTLDQIYAIKIFGMLLFSEERLTLVGIEPMLALHDDNTEVESLSDVNALRLVRDFTYSTHSNTVNFAYASAIDYFRVHRFDLQDYSDAECRAEMALICIKCISSPTHPPPEELIPNSAPWYASYF